MARKSWSIETWTGTAWISDGTIYRPNANTDIGTTSTQQSLQLANGGKAFVTPETPYDNNDITMQFLEIYPSDTFYTKIQAYVQNQNYVRITTHLGETFAGKFISCRRVWLIGVDDTFDIEVMFQRMDGIGVTSGGHVPQGAYVNWGAVLGDINLQTDLIAYITSHGSGAAWGGITGLLANQTDLQNALNLKLSDAPSDGTTYGRKNGAWTAVTGGAGTWGSITGTLSAQTDLQSALDAKSSTSHTHDDLYYGKPTVTTLLSNKANVIHSHTLDSLSDVVVNSGLSSYQVLTWNASAGVWYNKSLGLHDMHDVNIDNPQNNYVLTYNSSSQNWIPAPSQGGSIGSILWGNILGTLSNQSDLQSILDTKATNTHEHNDIYYTKQQVMSFLNAKADNLHSHTLDSLSDVIVNSGLTSGQALVWNTSSGVWHNATLRMNDLGNVEVDGSINNDILVYDAGVWKHRVITTLTDNLYLHLSGSDQTVTQYPIFSSGISSPEFSGLNTNIDYGITVYNLNGETISGSKRIDGMIESDTLIYLVAFPEEGYQGRTLMGDWAVSGIAFNIGAHVFIDAINSNQPIISFNSIDGSYQPSFVTSFQTGIQTSDAVYTLPLSSSEGVLTNNGSGILSWNNIFTTFRTERLEIDGASAWIDLSSGSQMTFHDSVAGSISLNQLATAPNRSGYQYWSPKYTSGLSVNWDNSNVEYIVLNNGDNDISFFNPKDGARYLLILKQPSSGTAGIVSWPNTILWAGGTTPTLTATNSKVDIITFVYDGSNTKYYGGFSGNY